MKKIFILLLAVVLMASSFVSCNKTEADEGRTLDITKISTAKKAVFGTASENSGAVSIDEAMDLAEKAWELCGKYDYIKTEYGTESIPDISKYTVDYVKELRANGTGNDFRKAYQEYLTYFYITEIVFIGLLNERFPDTAQVQWDLKTPERMLINVYLPECAYVLNTSGLSEEDYAELTSSSTAFLDMDVTVITKWGSDEYNVCSNGEFAGMVFPTAEVQAVLDVFRGTEASLAGVLDVAE